MKIKKKNPVIAALTGLTNPMSLTWISIYAKRDIEKLDGRKQICLYKLVQEI